MSMKWMTRPVLAGVLASAAFSVPAAAQTVIIGGPGGGGFNDTCPPNEFLVGVAFDVDKDLKTVQGVCQAFNGGHASGPTMVLANHGNGNSNGRYTLGDKLLCPNDMAVEGLQVQVSHVNLVHAFALNCRNPNAHNYVVTRFNETIGGQAAYTRPTDCGGGAIADGLIGRYGNNVDGMGLNCRVLGH